MPNSPSQPLPADLQNLDVHALQAMLLAERAKVSALQEKLQLRDTEIERLGLLIAKLRRMTFGRSSEKLSRQIEQLEFQLEELESDRAAEEIVAPQKQTTPGGGDKKKPARRSLPEHLPRDTRTHEPDDKACPQCQGKLHLPSPPLALVDRVVELSEEFQHVSGSPVLRDQGHTLPARSLAGTLDYEPSIERVGIVIAAPHPYVLAVGAVDGTADQVMKPLLRCRSRGLPERRDRLKASSCW